MARAALEARDFGKARDALAPLLAGGETRPSRRLCLLMADLEQTEHGARQRRAARMAGARRPRPARRGLDRRRRRSRTAGSPPRPSPASSTPSAGRSRRTSLRDDEPLALLEDAEPEADPLPSLPPMEARPCARRSRTTHGRSEPQTAAPNPRRRNPRSSRRPRRRSIRCRIRPTIRAFAARRSARRAPSVRVTRGTK